MDESEPDHFEIPAPNPGTSIPIEEDEELIDGVKMNHGELVLVVIQRLERLNRFTKSLRKGNYYDKWSKENLDDVVNWRFED